MSFNESIKIISNWADQYNNGDILEALHDMDTCQEYLGFREFTAYRTFMETGREFFTKA